jgi:tripartite-type tricarboxylate transporter receptor subunit TctC
MIRTTKYLALMMAAAIALAAFPQRAGADTYPSPGRPITLLVAYPAGAASDTVGRIIAEYLGQALKATIIVENRGGANGTIGTAYAARAAADGYTLVLVSNATHAANVSLYKSLRYDPVRDFEPIGKIATFNYLVLANPSVPASTMKELVARAKTNPNELTYAAGASSAVIIGESLKNSAGATLLKVPYRSNAQAMTDVIGERVSLTFSDIAVGLPYIESKKLKALAVTSRERSTILPDIPTLNETVLPGYDLVAWMGVVVPAGTPAPFRERLTAALSDILARPDVKQRFLTLGAEVEPLPGEGFRAFIQSEVVKWTKLITEAGIEAE